MNEIKIGIIGWGSLLWKPGVLKIKEDIWHEGPYLPIEFARVSKDGRLTLVIDEGNYRNTEIKKSQTWVAESQSSSIEDARLNLQSREGLPEREDKREDKREDREDIGRVGITSKNVCGISILIKEWLDGPENTKKFTDLLWTNLKPKPPKNYEKWEYADRCSYLRDKQKSNKEIELYIRKAPPTVRTPIRVFAEKEFGWEQDKGYVRDPSAKTIYFPKILA